jgi:hypothetical protein
MPPLVDWLNHTKKALQQQGFFISSRFFCQKEKNLEIKDY